MKASLSSSSLSVANTGQGSDLVEGFEAALAAAEACVRLKHKEVAQSSSDALAQAVKTVERRKAHERQLLAANGDADLVGE